MFQGTNGLLTTIIAIYGAILATLSLILSIILAIIEVRRHMAQVVVSAKHGYITDNFGKSSEPVIIITAINKGNGSISITGVGWFLKDGGKKQFLQPYNLQLPYVLQERRSCSTVFPCRSFKSYSDNEDIKAAFFQDETGKIWKGNISRIQRNLWLNAKDHGWHIY